MTTYPGMGLLLCLVFAVIGGPMVRLLAYLITAFPHIRVSTWLAPKEATARPRLTQALVIPISLAAAAVGVLVGWIDKLRAVLISTSGSASSVSAPPEQLALLLGGPVIVACVAAASIVFATALNRQKDNALLLISGATPVTVYTKAIIETIVYTVIALMCAYVIVTINEAAMVAALSSGPIPETTFALPGWESAGVVAFGGLLILVMLLVITALGVRKQPITIVSKEK